MPKELSNFISFVICKFLRFESKLFVLSCSLHISTRVVYISVLEQHANFDAHSKYVIVSYAQCF
jgi:hypothetical protein